MKYIFQTGIIFAVTLIGEILSQVIPLPVPGSIYGLVLLFALLLSGILKLKHVEGAGNFFYRKFFFLPAVNKQLRHTACDNHNHQRGHNGKNQNHNYILPKKAHGIHKAYAIGYKKKGQNGQKEIPCAFHMF